MDSARELEMYRNIGVIEERTRGLPEMAAQVHDNANDIRWFKRLIAPAIALTAAVGAVARQIIGA